MVTRRQLPGLGAVLATAIVIVGSQTGCSAFGCGDERLSESPSPDGNYTARIIERNCGATTDYARHVILTRTGFAGRFDSEESVFVVEGQVPVTVAWRGDSRHLSISATGGEVFRQESQWRDVRIEYGGSSAPQASR